MPFLFEKLEIYHRALKFVGYVEQLCSELKGKVSYPILDQLSRAAISVPCCSAHCLLPAESARIGIIENAGICILHTKTLQAVEINVSILPYWNTIRTLLIQP